MRVVGYHGTNQTFDRFEARHLGLANPNAASREAFFFALRCDTAWGYAHQAAHRLIPQQEEHETYIRQILDQAKRAEKRGEHAVSERFHSMAEEVEAKAMQADPAGARVLECSLKIENPFEIDGLSREVVTNLAGVLSRARDAGHDAVIIHDILDTPAGRGEPDTHVAVFDPSRITILEVLLESEEEVDLQPEF